MKSISLKPGNECRVGWIRYWCAGLLSVALAIPSFAQAGDWDFRHRTAVGLTYVDRDGLDAQDGVVLQAIPHLFLTGKGGRIEADVNYRLAMSAGSDGVDPRDFSHLGYGRVRGELVDDFFWLGAEATANLAGNSFTSGPVDPINADIDGRQVYTIVVRPEFKHHLNRYAEIVSLNWIDYVNNDADADDDDSHSAKVHIGARSGRYFSQFNWSVDASHRRTEFHNAGDHETRSQVEGTLRRRLNANWSVFGRAGYEDNDLRYTRDGDTSGSIWDLGGTWNPSPRTTIDGEFGERYFGNRYRFNARHTSRRTTLVASFSRDIDNRRNEQLYDSQLFLLDSNGNPILDPNTGNPVSANNSQTRRNDNDFVNTQFRGAVTVVGRRTRVTLTGTVSERDYDNSNTDDTQFIGTLGVSRQLGSGYRASLTGDARHTDVDNGGDSDTYSLNFVLSKNLSAITTVAVDLLYRDHNDSIPDESYTENRVGIWYRTTFL